MDSQLLPNTTQIPHIIIREWMPRLKDTELRVLLVVADQTLGWIEDPETGRRKDRDWISHYQLREKIRRKGKSVAGDRPVSHAIATLVDKLRIVEALDEQGNLLDTPEKRERNGGKIYYRLCLKAPQPTLFDHPRQKGRGSKKTPVKKTSYKRNPINKINTFKNKKEEKIPTVRANTGPVSVKEILASRVNKVL